jgi:hypothetical protein
MSCKCGARVKASGKRAGITPVRLRRRGPEAVYARIWLKSAGQAGPAGSFQELGTIEAGSKVEITGPWRE